MANNRMWLLHVPSGLAARIATFHGSDWFWTPNPAEELVASLNSLFKGDPYAADETFFADALTAPSQDDEFVILTEGDGKNWKYGDAHPTLPLRYIEYPKYQKTPQSPS